MCILYIESHPSDDGYRIESFSLASVCLLTISSLLLAVPRITLLIEAANRITPPPSTLLFSLHPSQPAAQPGSFQANLRRERIKKKREREPNSLTSFYSYTQHSPKYKCRGGTSSPPYSIGRWGV